LSQREASTLAVQVSWSYSDVTSVPLALTTSAGTLA